MRLIATMSALVTLFGSTCDAVEATGLTLQTVSPDGNLIFSLTSGAVEIPIAVRMLGVLRPLDESSRKEFREYLMAVVAQEKTTQPETTWSITAPGERFHTDEHGVVLARVISSRMRVNPDGSKIGGRSDLAGPILQSGLGGYDGSLEALDPQTHKMYMLGQNDAKKNGLGIWREPPP